MNKLLKKEFALSMHPTAPMFLALSAMLLIPNYPYYVTFFYMGLSLFFTCLSGRENNDVFYSITLPVSKKDVVGARFLYAVIFELAQIVLCVPLAFVRQKMNATVGTNAVGMDAGIALIGLSLVMLGLFNAVFFGTYYKDVTKVGTAFIKSSVAVFVYICAVEAFTHFVPFFISLDTPDSEFLLPKFAVLAAGLVIFALITFVSYKKSVKNFEKQDI